MPGDLLVGRLEVPIRMRMAALIRQRSIDVNLLMSTFLRRAPFSRMPQRGFACIDVPVFRRALSYVFGEQWSLLAMTSEELVEVYTPYILKEVGDGSVFIAWGSFARDITSAAGVHFDNRDYLQQETGLGDRLQTHELSDTFDTTQLRRVMDLLFSHDIETEAEKQVEVLKDIERVTGARSVAVTRYGSYESKLHGRNQSGAIKHGDFERIGGHGDYRALQGVSADGSNVRTVNTCVASQSHEYAADGTPVIDDGSASEAQATLTYHAPSACTSDPSAAMQVTMARAPQRPSFPRQPERRGSPRRAGTKGTPRDRQTSQRSARCPGADKYVAVQLSTHTSHPQRAGPPAARQARRANA